MTAPGERFAQLTYTSCDRDGRPGGWQVQDVAGTLSAAERTALTQRVVPRFTPVEDLPAYPDPAQRRALPRRVVHAPLPELGAAVAYWHSVPCGTDAHGRPGNVFVHVLLDRAPAAGAGAPAHPTDLAAAGGWLRPWGPDEVAAAGLAAVPSPPWPAAPDRAAVLDFLFDATGDAPGIASLCLVLDAVDAALRGGPPVVLGVAGMQRADLWVAAVSHLMSGGSASHLGWSTYERTTHARDWPADLQLVVVPATDLDVEETPGRPSDAVVLGEDEAVPRGELGGPPRTARRGDDVAVTPWSVMTFVLLSDRDRAADLLARMDAVSGRLVAGGTAVAHPAWAMAMAIAQAPDLAPDAVPAARAVLQDSSPADLATGYPDLYAPVLGLVGETVDAGAGVAGEAMTAALAGPTSAGRRAVLRDLFLLRLLDDLAERADSGTGEDTAARRYLVRDDGALPALAAARPVAAAVHDRAGEIAGALLGGLGGERSSPGRLRAVGRTAELAETLAAGGTDLRAQPSVMRLWDHVVEALLDPGDGPEIADRLGVPPGPATRRGVSDAVRRRLRGDPADPGTRIPAAVLRMVGVRLPRPAELAEHGGPDDLQRELAALATLADPDPAALAWLVATWDALDPRRGGDVAALERLTAPGRPADPDHLAVLVAHREHPALHPTVLATLLSAPASAGLGRLAEAVLGPPREWGAPAPGPSRPPGPSGAGDGVAARRGERPRRLTDAARLRLLIGDTEPARRDEMLVLARTVLAEPDPGAVDPGVWQAVVVALVLDTAARAWAPPEGARSGAGGWTSYERFSEHVVAGAAAVAGAQRHPSTATALSGALAGCPELDGASLVHAGLALRIVDDLGPAVTALRSLAATLGAGVGVEEQVVRAAHRRWRAGALEEADRETALRRLRRDRRGTPRGRRRSDGEDLDTAAGSWWGEVVARDDAPVAAETGG